MVIRTMLNRTFGYLSGILLCLPMLVLGQETAKYGADFLAGGVDARAMAMGNTHVAFANTVSSSYWNPAGLAHLQFGDLMYMHAERFGGIVSFDYAAAGFPVGKKSAVALGVVRSGVNDIKDTRDAWDFERDIPKPNPENSFRIFSAADYAFYLTYGRKVNPNLSYGLSGKVIRRKIGPFADAWGYSLDAGAQYAQGKLRLGVNLQDATTMLQSWSINKSEFEGYETYGVPEGGTVKVLPVLRLGSGYETPIGTDNALRVGLDLDVAFDGAQTYAFSAGNTTLHPRIGGEFSYKKLLAFRAGLATIGKDSDGQVAVQPMMGVGFTIKQAKIDYVFGDFSGPTSELGNSHMLSLRLTLEK